MSGGANSPDAEGQQLIGLVGTIPPEVAKLTRLLELRMQVGHTAATYHCSMLLPRSSTPALLQLAVECSAAVDTDAEAEFARQMAADVQAASVQLVQLLAQRSKGGRATGHLLALAASSTWTVQQGLLLGLMCGVQSDRSTLWC